MTLQDFLTEAMNHDVSKQVVVHVEGIDGLFRSVEVDRIESDNLVIVLRVTP